MIRQHSAASTCDGTCLIYPNDVQISRWTDLGGVLQSTGIYCVHAHTHTHYKPNPSGREGKAGCKYTKRGKKYKWFGLLCNILYAFETTFGAVSLRRDKI